MAFLQPVVPPTDADPALYNNQPPRQYQPAPLPPQVPQNFLQQVPTTYGQRMGVIEDLVGSKLGWDMADKQIQFGNQALQNPDLTDEQKQKITDSIDFLTKKRDTFADYANTVRQTASSLGLGDEFLAPYGSGKTLSEATQAYNNYATTAVRDLLATPSIDEQEQNRFMELWARGVSPAQAQRLVKFDHAKTQGDYERRIADGILTFGTNPNGSLNEIGMTLLNRAMNSSPKTAALFGGAYATPKDIFAANNTRDLAILGNTAAMERQAAQIAANYQNALEERQLREALTKYTVEHTDARHAADIESREKIALTNALKGTGVAEDKLAQEIDSVERIIGDRQKAAEIVLYNKYKDAFNFLQGDPKDLKDHNKFATFTRGQFGTIEYALSKDDKQTAKELIGQFRTNILGQNGEFKYSEFMDIDDAKFLLEQLDEYEQVADGKMSLAQLLAKRKHYPESPAGLSEANHDETLNAESKKIGEKAAKDHAISNGFLLNAGKSLPTSPGEIGFNPYANYPNPYEANINGFNGWKGVR